MIKLSTSAVEAPFVNVSQARWVSRVLNMLVAVVGRDSLLGLILRQARSEITSITREPRPAQPTR